MPVASIDGLPVNYVVKGEGTPLLMLAPGGFDSTIESWWTPKRLSAGSSMRSLPRRTCVWRHS